MKRINFMSPFDREKKESGFSLIELLIVIAILAVLMAIMIPKLLGGSDQKNAVAIMKISEGVSSGLIRYKSDLGKYPVYLQALWDKNAVPSGDQDYWKGPYLDSPAKTAGTDPNFNIADQNIAGVTYEYVKVTGSGGGSGDCANSTRIGANNPSGSDHTIKVSAVPHETALRIKERMGNQICLSDTGGDATDVYFTVEESW